MTDADLEEYLRGLGLTVESAHEIANAPYIIVRGFIIPSGPLAGRECDVALARCQTMPYLVPPAIHTRPALVPMNSAAPLAEPSGSTGHGDSIDRRRRKRSGRTF